MRMATTILGLIGRKQSGKDTFAQRLVEEHGFTRLGFADPLKALAEEMDPILFVAELDHEPVRLSHLLSIFTWDEAKERYAEVRQYLQNLGVAVRNNVVENAWIQALAERAYATPGPVVVTDCRFPNEAQWITGLGGETVRIKRPAADSSRDLHVSETALDAWVTHHVVINDRGVQELHETADMLASYIHVPRRFLTSVSV